MEEPDLTTKNGEWTAPLNRVAIILDERGEFSGVVADNQIDFYVVQPCASRSVSCRATAKVQFACGCVLARRVGSPPPAIGDERMTEAEPKELLAKAQARYDAMTPEQKAAHDKAQRESFVRAMKPTGDPRFD